MGKMKGTVVSFVQTKKYGFINGEDGESYFVHQSSICDSNQANLLVRGAVVLFDPKPTPKGLSAARIEVLPSIKAYELLPFFMTKSSKPRKGDIVRSAHTQTHFFKNPYDAKQHLKHITGCIGGNCILDLSCLSRTFSEGNYNYTMHAFSGTVALAYTETSVSDETMKAELDAEYYQSCEAFDTRVNKVIADQRDILENQINPKREGCLKSLLYTGIAIGVILYLASLR